MPIEKGKVFEQGDVYIEYDYEDVKFRWDSKTKTVFRKFYNSGIEESVPHDNKLFNEALLHGEVIDKSKYDQA